MLSFLNAGSLFLLAAVVIPLLVHLLARRKPQRVVFSSLRFIRLSQQQQRRRINLRQLLLLILRTLVILLVILAIFRPVVKLPGLQRSTRHPRTAVAIIIDNSYSMDWLVDTRTALDHAKEQAAALNAMLTAADMTLPLTRDRAWNRMHGTLRNGPLQDDLKDVAISPEAVPLDSLLHQAQRLLAAGDLPNREIYIFTDAQREALPTDLDTPWFLVPVGADPERGNLSCQNARLEEELVERRLEQRIGFDAVNHGDTPMRNVLCTLVLDGRTAAETVVDLEPHQRLHSWFTVNIERSGWHEGYAAVKNERLLFDNRSYFAFRYDLEPRVGVITSATALPLPLRAALEVFCGGQVSLLRGDESLDTLRGYHALLVWNVPLDTRLRFTLESLREDGRGLLFLAWPQMDGAWRDYLAQTFSLRLQDWQPGAAPITAVHPQHPITRLFAGSGLQGVQVKGWWRAQASGADALLATGSSPLALAAGGSHIWLFDVSALDSPFLLDSAYPVLLYRTLQTLAGGGELPRAYTVGNRLPVQGRTVVLPDGAEIQSPEAALVAAMPGVYRLGLTDDAPRLAVNLDNAESDYAPLPATDKHLLSAADWQQQALPGRYGFETWKLLLAAALLLVAAEMLLVKRGERRAGENK